MIPEEFTLQEICLLITDGAHNSPKSVSVGLPMASVKDLSSFGINLQTCRLISENDFIRLVNMNCQPIKGDVLIAKDGASALDTVCEIRNDLDVVLLSSVAILRPNPDFITPTFLRYYLDNPRTRRYIKGAFITGAAIPRVVLEDFKRVKVTIPPLPAQRKITSILSAYDDLIENNNGRIQILEDMAQAIYREWFVHFRFPGHEDVKMVESELGMIPEGWEVISVSDLVKEIKERNVENTYYPTLTVTKNRRFVLSGDYFSKRVYSKKQNKYKIIKSGQFAFNPARINIGSMAFMEEIETGIVSPMYCVFEAKPGRVLPPFLWEKINDEKTFNHIKKLCFGTVRQIFKFQSFDLVKIILPPIDLQKKFASFIFPMKSLIKNLHSKSKKLHDIRSIILPRLISGELDVSEIEIE